MFVVYKKTLKRYTKQVDYISTEQQQQTILLNLTLDYKKTVMITHMTNIQQHFHTTYLPSFIA